LILGAGFSHVAGHPLAKDLFDSEFVVPSREAKRRYEVVLRGWQAWKSINPGQGPEQFLTELYRAAALGPIPWAWAAELVAAILATPLPHDRRAHQARYGGRITRPVNVPSHEAFWDVVSSRFSVTAVVTSNYDILAERGLRHRPMRRPNRPGVYYGGLGRPQVLKGTALPFSVAKPERFIELEGNIPLYKLHGSLNWGLEARNLTLYQDLRPAFRHGGDAQIVPPVVEKEAPAWLLDIWDGARRALAACSTWLVCGYSLPFYDKAITQLIAEAGRAGAVARVVLMDPNATELASRWQAIAPTAELHPLPGLPEALRPLLELAG
jgi:hypothetical protein